MTHTIPNHEAWHKYTFGNSTIPRDKWERAFGRADALREELKEEAAGKNQTRVFNFSMDKARLEEIYNETGVAIND